MRSSGFDSIGKGITRSNCALLIWLRREPISILGEGLAVARHIAGQVHKLLCRGFSAQCLVAMRIAAEAGNDFPVVASIRRQRCRKISERGSALGIETLGDAHGALLDGKVLGVLQWQAKEPPRYRIDFAVHAAVDGVKRQTKRAGVTVECAGAAPMDVAVELIQNDDQRQAGQGLVLSASVRSGDGGLDR